MTRDQSEQGSSPAVPPEVRIERWRFATRLVTVLGVVGAIVAFALVLWAMSFNVKPLAGKDTGVDVGLRATIGISIGFTLALAGTGTWIVLQRLELRRLRSRLAFYEARSKPATPKRPARARRRR